MRSGSHDDQSAAAAELASATVRFLKERGVPEHRFKSMAELLEAEVNAAMDQEFSAIAKRIGAAPQQYDAAQRQELVRAALARGMERARAAFIEQAEAWSETGDPNRAGSSERY